MNLGKIYEKVTFLISGGLELLFNKLKKMDLEVENNTNNSLSLKELIEVLKGKIIEKHDFFLTKDNQM